MKIENVEKTEKSKEIFTINFDNGTNIKVSTTQIADFGLYSGRELTDEEYIGLKSAIERSSSKARALRILGNRSLSAKDMERRLVSKGESADTAQETVEWLVENKMINDSEYAVSIARHYKAKGYGPMRIKDELYKRGIPREMWESAMNGTVGGADGDGANGEKAIGYNANGDDEYADAALEFVRKKLKGSKEKSDIQNAAAALYRRGFGYEDARTAVRKYLESTDGADGMENE